MMSQLATRVGEHSTFGHKLGDIKVGSLTEYERLTAQFARYVWTKQCGHVTDPCWLEF